MTEISIIRSISGGRGANLGKIGDGIPSHSEGYEITDLDPEGAGAVFPRAIEVQTNDTDGAKLLALWHGDFGLSVGDFVRCRRDPSSPVLIIEGYGGGTSATAGSGVWPEPNKLKIGTTEYATLSAAVAAVSSGETILIGAGEHVSDAVTIPTGVTVKGTGKYSTVLYTTTGADVVNVASGSTVTLQDLTCDNRATTGNPFAVQGSFSGTAGATITMVDCVLTNTTSGGSQRGGFAATNGTHRLIDCEITVSGGTTNYGVIGAHNSTGINTITLNGGSVSGATADLRTTTANGNIRVSATELVNNTTSVVAGTIEGGYHYAGDSYLFSNLSFIAAGATINEFSTDGTMAGNSNTALPTEAAIVTYVTGRDTATPHCLAYHSTTQSISDSTNTVINLDSETFDVGNNHNTVTNNSRLTSSVSGVYAVTAGCGFAANTTGFRRVSVLLDGTTRYFIAQLDGQASNMVIATSGILRISSGSYIELEVHQTSGGNLNTYRPVTTAPFLGFSLISYI